MSWKQINEFTLYPSDMCIGQYDFQPYVPQFLMYGLEAGKYKIQYVSGAVRSNSFQRFQKVLLTKYEYKWNKYYIFQQINPSELSYNFSLLSQLKLNVFQCQFGTLPGFTHEGAYLKQLAQYNAKKQIDLNSLQFEISDNSDISFWYVDDCAPCVQGYITYKLYKNVEDLTVAINGLSVISFNIYNLESNISEYYKLTNKNINTTLFNIPYKYQQNLLQINSKKQYILNLKSYNTIGYNENKNSIFLTFKNSENQISDEIFWKITKYKSNTKFNIITEITKKNTEIPLFKGTYTLIPNNKLKFEKDKILITYNKEQYIPKQNELTNFIFNLNATTLVTIYDTGYLYSGKVFISELLNKNIQIYNTNADEEITIANQEIQTLLKNINVSYFEYYLYITTDFIKIISSNINNKNINNLYGPFLTIQKAQAALINYCIKNSLNYEKITDVEYVISD